MRKFKNFKNWLFGLGAVVFILSSVRAETTYVDIIGCGGVFNLWPQLYISRADQRSCYLKLSFRPLLVGNYQPYWNESLWERNTPLFWVFKNGRRVEEITISEIDPQRTSLRGANCLEYAINTPYLRSGESAEFKLKVDPLNQVTEGKFEDGHLVESFEVNNNLITFSYTCNDVALSKISCPSARVMAGEEVRVEAKVEKNFQVDPQAPVAVEMFLERSGRKIRLGGTEVSASQNLNLTARVPTETSKGNYQLLVEARVLSGYQEVNTRNNVFRCPVNVQRIDDVDLTFSVPREMVEGRTSKLSWKVLPRGLEERVWENRCQPRAELYYQIPGKASWTFIYGQMLDAIPQEFGGYYVYRWRVPGICREEELQEQRCRIIDNRDLVPAEVKLVLRCQSPDFRNITMEDTEDTHIRNLRPHERRLAPAENIPRVLTPEVQEKSQPGPHLNRRPPRR